MTDQQPDTADGADPGRTVDLNSDVGEGFGRWELGDDAAVIAIVDKLVKQRKDSIQQFTAGGRQDLVDKENAELTVLEGYLPVRLGAEEIAAEFERFLAGLDSDED